MTADCTGIRQLLMDQLTLEDYELGRNVGIERLRSRLLVNERKINSAIPDHLYRVAIDAVLERPEQKVSDLPAFLINLLKSLADGYIIKKGSRLYIKPERFGAWQDLLTLCPPLILIATALYHYFGKPEGYEFDATVLSAISDNARYTALLPPYLPQLDDLRRENGGFNDLHIHLSGYVEADMVWQDALNDPHGFKRRYNQTDRKSIEQNDQENVFKDGDELERLLHKARALRYYLVQCVMRPESFADMYYPDFEVVINKYDFCLVRNEHPMLCFCPDLWQSCKKSKRPMLEYECLFYMHVLHFLQDENQNEMKPVIAKAFHHYLLILGAVNRFLVQQLHQKGFLQFQKIPANKLRGISESAARDRFFQLCGNNLEQPYFKIIEGRFSPHILPSKINRFVQNVRDGWDEFKSTEGVPNTVELRLVAHFIKGQKPESIWEQAEALVSLWRDDDWNSVLSGKQFGYRMIVGIDAASSEFNASPEIFAPVFRKIRRELGDKCGFTYHVGEDFSHILSGLRAIYETIEFMDFAEGDRLGHATALGIDPELWQRRLDKEFVYMRQGELLDDLVFVYHLCYDRKGSFGCMAEKLKKKILEFTKNVYDVRPTGIHGIIDAWLYRRWNPDAVSQECPSEWRCDLEEWSGCRKAHLSPVSKKLYHSYLTRNTTSPSCKYNVLTEVSLAEYRCYVDMVQRRLAKLIKRRKIIIETMPTSNVRIAAYRKYAEHHLRRWVENKLTVVVGSDDAGIFATNIYNEYAHIYNECLPHRKAKKEVQKIVQSAGKYVFGG